MGDTVDFEVLDEVKVGDVVVVPVGSIAWGTVTEAEHKKRMGRAGKLNMNIDSVRLSTGQKAALRAIQGGSGGGHVGAMTGAIVATSLIVWPAAPFFLFMHGKDMTIPKGTAITAYINGNIPLDKSAFLSAAPEAKSTSASANSILEVTSTPANCDLELDGAFVGSAPSSIQVPSGDHTIAVVKKGYKRWERKIKVSPGTIHVNAELEAETPAP